jgi:hypothetical protein
MTPSWIGRHFGISVEGNFTHHLKVFPKYVQLFKLDENCKIHTCILKLIYTRWCHLGLAAILKRQKSKISYIIFRHFQNIFIFKNRFKSAKVIEQITKI